MILEIARTFQNLSKPFIFLPSVSPGSGEVPRGDPKRIAHRVVNRLKTLKRNGARLAVMLHRLLPRRPATLHGLFNRS